MSELIDKEIAEPKEENKENKNEGIKISEKEEKKEDTNSDKEIKI